MITNWLDCVNKHDVDKVVELYADDATLWGTFSEIRRDGLGLIREYFDHFLGLDGLQAAVTQLTRRHLGAVTLYSGQYVFRYRQDGADRQVRARFTLVTRTRDGVERILEHHSSVLPKSAG